MKYSEVKLSCHIVPKCTNESTDTFLVENGWEMTRTDDGLDVLVDHRRRTKPHDIDESYRVPWSLVQYAIDMANVPAPMPIPTPVKK